MNNDELKKKIVDIIALYVSAYGDDEAIADDLIAAGIGDVKEAERRAEVAERALEYACLDFATCYPSGTWNDFVVEYADRCRRQAERILKEERKDD